MNDETLDEVLERLKRIEERLDRLESRPAERVVPPPVLSSQLRAQRVVRSYEQRRPRQVRTPPPTEEPVPPKAEKPTEKREDQEFVFGSKVLPRVGMVIVLLAIFYLVAMGIQQGWITPTVQFIGELALCGGLIGIGIWKLNEREDFGQVLVGGGSCGLYLSFAGAYAYKETINDESLISGEVLVVLFVLLSLANFAFSWWRSSKSFWMIGYIGGLVAAGMPMERSDYSSSLVLAGIIVLAATFLAAYRQWFKALSGLWLVSSIFVLLVTQQATQAGAMSPATAILILCGFSFVPISAYALRFVPSKFDEKGWSLLVAGGLTALATLTFGKEILPVPHSVSVVLWSLSLLALGWYIRKQPHSSILVYTGIGAATVVAPMGFAAYPACLTYAALGLLTTAFVMVRRQGLERTGAIFSASYVVLTITAYVIAMAAGPLETAVEMTMLGAIALGIANVAYVAGKLEENMATAVTAAAAVFYLILTRAAYISAAAEPAYAVVLGQSVYVVVLAIVAIRAKWSGLGVLGLIFGGFAAAIYWLAVVPGVGSDISTGREISVLLVLTAALVLSAIGAGRDDKERQTSSVAAAIIGGFVVVPAIYLMLGPEALGLSDAPAVATAIATYAIVLGVLSMFAKWPGHAIVGSAAILIGTLYYWVEIVGRQGISGTGIQLFLTLLMSAAIVMSAFGAGREAVGKQIAWVGASVLGLFVLARAFFLVLTLPALGLDAQTAHLASWAIYAIILAVASKRAKLHAVAFVSYAVTLLSVAFYWSYRSEGLLLGLGDQLMVMGLQSIALVMGALCLGRSKDELHKAAVLTAIVGWFVFARMINVALILPAIGMAEQAALTLSWSLYSALVLYLGFVFDFKNLRITSLVMFGVTIVKVFVVDLAELDEIVRVLVLIVLGGLLLLAGYIYVRKRQAAPKERDAD